MIKLKNTNSAIILTIWIVFDLFIWILEYFHHHHNIFTVFKISAMLTIFTGFIFGFGCWNVYIFKEGIGFKNYWLFYLKNKYKYIYEEIGSIEITHGKNGPFIRVNANGKTKKFYSIGYKKTKIFVDLMIEKGVKVIDENEYEAPIRKALFPKKKQIG